jgi:cbb3-type cytochrome oxidase subunit 3
MSLLIFFGFAFFIFTASLIVISVTFYQWRKEAKKKSHQLNLNPLNNKEIKN